VPPLILGLIPARGGSKGVPQKNIRQIAGRPLIGWTIEAAQAATRLDRLLVSTDDQGIAEVARALGAEVLARPADLATDRAPLLGVMQHALSAVPADVLVLLQPTSPIRSPDLIDRCVERFFRTDADSLATGFVCKYVEYGRDVEVFGSELQRQDLPGFFYDDGSVYVIRASLLVAGDRYGERMEHFPTDREENVEVDDDFDCWLAEQILLRRLSGRSLVESRSDDPRANE
jgi:CMP-N,N'-diacetyllegionaminic acid synthase